MNIQSQTNQQILTESDVNSEKYELESHTDHSEEESRFSNKQELFEVPETPATPIVDSFALFCQNYASKKYGSFIKKMETKQLYLFNCAIQHKFFLSQKQISTGTWCSNCKKLHNNLNNFAITNNGSLITPIMKKRMSFKCCRSHVWSISYKKASQRWCKICSKQAKRMIKNIIEIENARIESEKKVNQVI